MPDHFPHQIANILIFLKILFALLLNLLPQFIFKIFYGLCILAALCLSWST